MLKPLEVLASFIYLSRALQCARQPELRRGMNRVDRKRLLKCGNRVVVLLQLLVAGANKVERIGVVWIDLRGLLKAFERAV